MFPGFHNSNTPAAGRKKGRIKNDPAFLLRRKIRLLFLVSSSCSNQADETAAEEQECSRFRDLAGILLIDHGSRNAGYKCNDGIYLIQKTRVQEPRGRIRKG